MIWKERFLVGEMLKSFGSSAVGWILQGEFGMPKKGKQNQCQVSSADRRRRRKIKRKWPQDLVEHTTGSRVQFPV